MWADKRAMKRQNLRDALDECLILMNGDRVSLDVCLARYPEQADELRPLLDVARRLRSAPRPVPTEQAVRAGRRRMLGALQEKTQRQAQSDGGSLSCLWRWMAGGAARKMPRLLELHVPVFAAGAATLAVLALILAGGFLFHSWLGVSVARTAQLDTMKGFVEVWRADGEAWVPAQEGDTLRAGSTVRTGESAVARLALFDGSSVTIEGGTELTLEQMAAQRDGGARVIVMRQARGRTDHSVRRLPDASSRFEVRTETAVASVRGTEFAVAVANDGTTRVAVWKGLVEVVGDQASVELLPGWATNVGPDRLPSDPVVMPTPEEGADVRALPSLEPTAASTSTPTATPSATKMPTLTPTDEPTETAAPTEMPAAKVGGGGSDETDGELSPSATPTRVVISTPTPTRVPTRTCTPTVGPGGSGDGSTRRPPTDTPVPTPTDEPVPSPTPGPEEPSLDPTATPTEAPPPSPTPGPSEPG